jgi:hypothetical protein
MKSEDSGKKMSPFFASFIWARTNPEPPKITSTAIPVFSEKAFTIYSVAGLLAAPAKIRVLVGVDSPF